MPKLRLIKINQGLFWPSWLWQAWEAQPKWIWALAIRTHLTAFSSRYYSDHQFLQTITLLIKTVEAEELRGQPFYLLPLLAGLFSDLLSQVIFIYWGRYRCRTLLSSGLVVDTSFSCLCCNSAPSTPRFPPHSCARSQSTLRRRSLASNKWRSCHNTLLS